MNRILTKDVWTVAKKLAQGTAARQLAIAYITKNHIGMRAGDTLVCDASDLMIRTGQTDAKLLKRLHDDGVAVHSVPGLHSKVMLLGTHAILGSANMSGSGSIEASVVTDRTQVRSGVASFIAQLARPTAELDGPELDRLCRIKVVRTGGRGGPRNLRRTKRLDRRHGLLGCVNSSAIPLRSNRSKSTVRRPISTSAA